jgi:succinate dehydrogenase / fumarate reductase cytochrome b subunit
MAEAATGALERGAPDDVDRTFLWRRLHSLSGIVPIGGFLCFHLFENMAAIKGQVAYDEGVEKIANLLPGVYLYSVEMAVLMVPILFHSFYGIYITLKGKPNVPAYPYRRNVLYVLQRTSGVVALLFILAHVGTLRVATTMLQRGHGLPGHPGYVSYLDVKEHLSNPYVFALYVLGTLASVFHFASGLNGFCFTWGIAVGEKARKAVEGLSWGVFLALAVPTLHILVSFR